LFDFFSSDNFPFKNGLQFVRIVTKQYFPLEFFLKLRIATVCSNYIVLQPHAAPWREDSPIHPPYHHKPPTHMQLPGQDAGGCNLMTQAGVSEGVFNLINIATEQQSGAGWAAAPPLAPLPLRPIGVSATWR
jgi:hypothetical protein